MKQSTKLFYENKNQSIDLERTNILIDKFLSNNNDLILKGKYVHGIPFLDEVDNVHYVIPGKILIEILCKNAKINSPLKRKSKLETLVVFSPTFLNTFYTLCFTDYDNEYREVKCKNYYILSSESFYKIQGEYISVNEYRERQTSKNKPVFGTPFDRKFRDLVGKMVIVKVKGDHYNKTFFATFYGEFTINDTNEVIEVFHNSKQHPNFLDSYALNYRIQILMPGSGVIMLLNFKKYDEEKNVISDNQFFINSVDFELLP